MYSVRCSARVGKRRFAVASASYTTAWVPLCWPRSAFGLSTTLTNTGGVQTPEISPRATGISGLGTSRPRIWRATKCSLPAVEFIPTDVSKRLDRRDRFYAVYFGMDDKMKTPYSYTLDFSIGRELRHGYAIQVSYVGRLSHRL